MFVWFDLICNYTLEIEKSNIPYTIHIFKLLVEQIPEDILGTHQLTIGIENYLRYMFFI